MYFTFELLHLNWHHRICLQIYSYHFPKVQKERTNSWVLLTDLCSGLLSRCYETHKTKEVVMTPFPFVLGNPILLRSHLCC